MHKLKAFQALSLLSLLISLLGLPIQKLSAQSDWFVYLYDSVNKRLLRVNQDGTSQEFSLGLSENQFFSPWDSAFSPDGNRVVFCSVDFSLENQGATRLYVRDIVAESNLLEVDLGQTIGCALSRDAISPDASQMVVSVVNYYPGAAELPIDPNLPIWQLFVMDINSGEVLHELNALSPSLAAIETPANTPALPNVRYFANNQVIFLDVPYGIGGAPSFPSYLWQIDTGAVSRVVNWESSFLDRLGNELVWVDIDPNLPAGQSGGPIPSFNILVYVDEAGEKRVIYHDPAWVLTNARFINSGRQVAVQLLAPFNPDSMDAQSSRWVVLDRSGTVSDLVSVGNYSEIAPTADGYLLLAVEFLGDNFSNPQSRLLHYNDANAQELWKDPSSDWTLAWYPPIIPAEGLAPFPVVGN